MSKTYKSKWNEQTVTREAKRHKTKHSFFKSAQTAYNRAKKLGIFEEVTSHMISPQKPRGYWTKEKLQEEALIYTTRDSFRAMNSGAYTTARVRGFLDEICSHMKRGSDKDFCRYNGNIECSSMPRETTDEVIERVKSRPDNFLYNAF